MVKVRVGTVKPVRFHRAPYQFHRESHEIDVQMIDNKVLPYLLDPDLDSRQVGNPWTDAHRLFHAAMRLHRNCAIEAPRRRERTHDNPSTYKYKMRIRFGVRNIETSVLL